LPSDLKRAITTWLADGKAQGWSQRTVNDRQQTMERFCWWLENEEEAPLTLDSLTLARIRAFLAYAREPRPEGRYGSDKPQARGEARPATVNAYFRMLRAFSNFCLAEGLLRETPLKNVKAPKIPKDQVQPLAAEQVQSLLDAARRGSAPERNAAMIFVFVDSGLRASELSGLTVGAVDRGTGELVVTGKGNKQRRVRIETAARRALWRYLEAERRGALAEEPLFTSIGGTRSGSGFTPRGIHDVVSRIGAAAGITGVRVSPHTLRHTFALNFLRAGGNLLELQTLMGHEDLTVLQRYVALAEADVTEAHRKASPAAWMKLK
jgi:site-specific recombinase XerD